MCVLCTGCVRAVGLLPHRGRHLLRGQAALLPPHPPHLRHHRWPLPAKGPGHRLWRHSRPAMARQDTRQARVAVLPAQQGLLRVLKEQEAGVDGYT